MKTHWIKFTVVPLLVLILGACSSLLPAGKSTENEPGILSDNESPAVGPQDEGGAEIIAQGNNPADKDSHNNNTCEDPFEGGPTPAFRTDGWETNFCLHSISYDDISSGGPARDGIPPIDSPRFETVGSADNWIEDLEPVIILDLAGDVRAYPLQILIWHEIVNDEVGGEPVVVTFCPLCNTALAFSRPETNGETLTFGTSGNLRFSDLVMWDRQTESWWQQFSGEAIVGDLTGTRLEFLPSAIISWEDFKSNHPDGRVLSIQTGFSRSYGRNPYPGYDNINSYPFAFTGNHNDRLPAMARVVGIMMEDGLGGAYSLDLLQEKQVLNESLGEVPITIFWKPGTASAVDSGTISSGRDVGSSGVFLRTIEDQSLTFSAIGDGLFIDQETGSSWNIFGEVIEGPLAGTRLVSLPHHDTFWFAWAAFVPDSTLTE